MMKLKGGKLVQAETGFVKRKQKHKWWETTKDAKQLSEGKRDRKTEEVKEK